MTTNPIRDLTRSSSEVCFLSFQHVFHTLAPTYILFHISQNNVEKYTKISLNVPEQRRILLMKKLDIYCIRWRNYDVIFVNVCK